MSQEQWLDKLETIQAFRVTRSRLNKALILQVRVTNCTRWLTVSWRKGSSKKRKEENPLQSSFRQAVHRQIMFWRKNNSVGAKCANCECSDYSKLQVDHKSPLFIKLTQDFLEIPINKIVPEDFDYHYKCGRKFKKQDYHFKRRWQNYHSKNATLQWLCKKCNLSKKKF